MLARRGPFPLVLAARQREPGFWDSPDRFSVFGRIEQIDRIAREHDVRPLWRPHRLHPDTPPEGAPREATPDVAAKRERLHAWVKEMAPEHPLLLTPSEQRGREIYVREGCAYCHTQQVRYTHADMERFGAPTLAWETRQDYPHLWGTRRIGPDLSRQYQVHPADWHFAHLYAPRSVVADSVMPAFQS